jgi:hypothetical protein
VNGYIVTLEIVGSFTKAGWLAGWLAAVVAGGG